MHILENTDDWMVCLFQTGKAISAMDKRTEKIYDYHGSDFEKFRFLLYHVHKTHTLAGSTHYMRSWNNCIAWVVEEMEKKGH